MQGTVAIVDDDEAICEIVSEALEKEGYRVQTFYDGQEAWEAWDEGGMDLPDVAVLDIRMPHMDGLELCRRLKMKSHSLPIFFLTGQTEEHDRVLGLELGADDYLCKPFSIKELIARVRVMFRRLAAGQEKQEEQDGSDTLHAGFLEMDLLGYSVKWREASVQLTYTEFMLLKALVRHPGHVKSRDQLLDEGYPDGTIVSDRTIDSHIKRLRKKFSAVDPGFKSVESIYGLGYRFIVDSTYHGDDSGRRFEGDVDG